MREEFDAALEKDLGYNKFMAVLTTHSMFEAEIKHIIANF